MVERRHHKRYAMPRGTLAILRSRLGRLRNHSNMQIGEIAMVLYKSDTSVIGQVTDMSFGGLSFNADPFPDSDVSGDELDLLMTEQGIYLHNVPYVEVPARCDDTASTGDTARTVALRFKELNTEHKAQLRELIAHHVG